MGRLQLALNVNDIEEAKEFYTKLFGASPAKERPGYANYALDDPSLKLVLIETPGAGGTLNHVGVEVFSTDEVVTNHERVASTGLEVAKEETEVDCCYAVQNKFWLNDPDGMEWEYYTVLADGKRGAETVTSEGAAQACC